MHREKNHLGQQNMRPRVAKQVIGWLKGIRHRSSQRSIESDGFLVLLLMTIISFNQPDT